MANAANLRDRIHTEANRLGFQKVGIIPAPTLRQELAQLQSWLDRGFQANMQWMEQYLDKRLNPAGLMEETQTVVCVAMNYFSPLPENPQPDAVKIARYALGRDYHKVLKKRLKKLLKTLQAEFPGLQGRALTDSAPIMEKALAIRAGLGWMGKNGNLLTKDYGSWLFLGELLLNVPVEAEPVRPSPDYCGTCNRCIVACPTQAIVSPTVVDANRCIAYWTIEHKGPDIPTEIASQMAGWVFGCDICQEVCPWNERFAQPTQEADFLPRAWNQTPTASELMALDEEAFHQRYVGSSLQRARRSGLQRNVAAWLRHSSQPPTTTPPKLMS
ncbi:MAG: tRNA epoxyqueuosine(34) reductase QueG [Candidatus Melainabacteria bacterium]|nr:tRNA epoxyqueuosine(34) reductase QueG [Candidatus Melainabacteria bacterium]